MTNYENLKAAAQSLGDFCDNHEAWNQRIEKEATNDAGNGDLKRET